MRRLDTAGGNARYRLEVELDDQIIGFGVRRDEAVTRERRTLRTMASAEPHPKGLRSRLHSWGHGRRSHG